MSPPEIFGGFSADFRLRRTRVRLNENPFAAALIEKITHLGIEN
jgi:hypothetical protein